MLQCKPNKEIKNQSTQPTAPSNDKGEPTKTTMGNTNSITISESMIPRLIPGLLPDHIRSLRYDGIETVEDVERLNRESIEIVLGTDPATADVRNRLLYVAEYLRLGGNLQNEDLTMIEVSEFVNERNNHAGGKGLRKVLGFVVKAVLIANGVPVM